ncbi:MAG: hypothetical protein DYG93_02740 [Leptolyngbya sp. PLA2]|nr:hypothetical protein [Leptolyngbya sp. PL-A2]MCQ3940431.1 hypothetical protein [cyanobacterium CYA1]MCZ7633896.1 hypothetical protein [Phycisphaerales bacterium]MDL1904281.1 hypothetical protein [Synechococcales cyanobacterium CNB]
MEGPRSSPPCVLWHAPRVRPPAALLEALRRRGIEPTAEIGPYAAFARLLRMSKSAGHPRPVLVLVEPDSLPDWDRVVAAAVRFVPAAVCWAFRAGNPDSLTVVESPRPKPVTFVHPAPAPASGAPLRLSGTLAGASAATPGANGQKSSPEPDSMPNARTLLTEEELAMLLADEPTGDAQRGR